MSTVSTEDPVAIAAVTAIHSGDLATLKRLLTENPWLATARLGDDDPDGMSRTLLHVVTDWPGHFPHGGVTVSALVDAGADVNARFRGPHEATPLHWAASTDDVEVLDALLDAGADIEAPAQSSEAVPRWQTRGGSRTGRLRTDWWSAAPGPHSSTPRRSGCPTA